MSDSRETRDQLLFKKIAAGDTEAFSELYDLYSPLLFPLIKKIVTEEKTAEYILSEVFKILWSKAPSIKLKNVYVWMIMLARNRAVDSQRRSVSTSTTIDFYDGEYEDFFIVPAISPLSEPLTAEIALEKKEDVREAVNSLTEAQRYVIHLSFYEGLNLVEIAKKLKIPVETVRTKTMIALQNLKENLVKPGVSNG